MIFCLLLVIPSLQPQRVGELGNKVEDLDAAEDGEGSEESHCATYQVKSSNHGHPDLRFVKKFTRPDFQAKNFTH